MNSGLNVPCANSDEYETPPWLFKALDTEFAFDFDAAASAVNHLCENYAADIESWVGELHTHPEWSIFCNPPYSNISLFMKVAFSTRNPWVFLLPTRTGTEWFRWLLNEERKHRAELRFLRKRIRFLINGKEPLNPKTGKPSGPRFDSMIAVIR